MLPFYFIFIFHFITYPLYCSNQAECEELQSKVEILSNENHVLREELHRLAEQCEKLTSENNSIMVSWDCFSFILSSFRILFF